jgi:hypothetical protein
VRISRHYKISNVELTNAIPPDLVEKAFTRQGHTLLEKNYINNATRMKYQCRCGTECEITYASMRIGHGGCKSCTKSKYTDTMITKYGKPHALQVPQLREKKDETCLLKYGTVHPSQADEVNEKIKLTTVNRYGATNVFRVPAIRVKAQQTSSKRYGRSYAIQSDIVKAQRVTNTLRRYGVASTSQLESVKAYYDDEVWLVRPRYYC